MKTQLWYGALSLLIACGCAAPAKSLGDGKFEVTCKGDDDTECQEQAWKTCNGAYKTLEDDRTSKKWEYVDTNMGSSLQQVKRYKIDFQCGEK